MRQLILWRHAKAEAPDRFEQDHPRPLSESGRREAVAAAQWMAANAIRPQLVYCSDARRTQQSWELAAPLLPPAKLEVSRDFYLASAGELLRRIAGAPQTVQRLMVVGHNPGLHDLARQLADGGSAADIGRLQVDFPTACLAVLGFDGEWSGLSPAGASLLALKAG